MARLISRLPMALSRYPLLRGPLRFMHQQAIRARPSMRRHPYDVRSGISAEGYLPWWLLRSGSRADVENSGYAGCQPSCLRRGLSTIPEASRFVYLDIGCGKGRSMAVASELPFRRIVGIEISRPLVPAAQRNGAALRRRFPERTPIEVIEGDATRAALPPGDLVVFLYHPFGRPLLARFLAALVAGRAGHEMFVVYESPVEGDLLDDTPGFERWHAETVACDPDERGCAPIDHETVVTWRWGGALDVAALPGADARIIKIDGRPDLARDHAEA